MIRVHYEMDWITDQAAVEWEESADPQFDFLLFAYESGNNPCTVLRKDSLEFKKQNPLQGDVTYYEDLPKTWQVGLREDPLVFSIPEDQEQR